MLDKIPQVFISYSWTSNEYQEKVVQLATKLRRDGIDVKLDVWDLREGQDKYVFMEQCVNNAEIDKVLILSDQRYAEKADERKGGVGDETTIISAEVYGNVEQTKFIPVIMERDSSGAPFLPAYLKSRLYRDLSGQNYDEEYRELIRTIYDEPSHQKPQIGKKPAWLTETISQTMFPLKDAIENISKCKSEKMARLASRRFIDLYVEALKPFFKENPTVEEYLSDFTSLKEYRNLFLDHLEPLAEYVNFGEALAGEFENLYNSLYDIRFFAKNKQRYSEESFDLFRLHIWELFVCATTFMLHHEMFSELGSLLRHTYFLRTSGFGDNTEPSSYEKFRFHSWMMEDVIKPSLEGELQRKFTLTGHYLVTERDYLPIYSGVAMASADLFLYQVYHCLNLEKISTFGFAWFPTCYIYTGSPVQQNSIWKKTVSKKFCEKIMPLFGAETMTDFKAKIAKGMPNPNITYRGCWTAAPAILTFVKLEEIGTLP